MCHTLFLYVNSLMFYLYSNSLLDNLFYNFVYMHKLDELGISCF